MLLLQTSKVYHDHVFCRCMKIYASNIVSKKLRPLLPQINVYTILKIYSETINFTHIHSFTFRSNVTVYGTNSYNCCSHVHQPNLTSSDLIILFYHLNSEISVFFHRQSLLNSAGFPCLLWISHLVTSSSISFDQSLRYYENLQDLW